MKKNGSRDKGRRFHAEIVAAKRKDPQLTIAAACARIAKREKTTAGNVAQHYYRLAKLAKKATAPVKVNGGPPLHVMARSALSMIKGPVVKRRSMTDLELVGRIATMSEADRATVKRIVGDLKGIQAIQALLS